MNKLFQGLEYIFVYLDERLVLTTGDFTNHLIKLEKVVIKLQEKGITINTEKSSFVKSEM